MREVKANIKAGVLFNALSSGSANSFTLQTAVKNWIMKGKFDLGVFPVDYALKDLVITFRTSFTQKMVTTSLTQSFKAMYLAMP